MDLHTPSTVVPFIGCENAYPIASRCSLILKLISRRGNTRTNSLPENQGMPQRHADKHNLPKSGADVLDEVENLSLRTPTRVSTSYSGVSPVGSNDDTSFHPIPFQGNIFNGEDAEDENLSLSMPNMGSTRQWLTPRMARRNSETTLTQKRPSRSYLLSPKKWFASGKRKKKKSLVVEGPYSIEYSVFRPINYLPQIKSEADLNEHLVNILRQENPRQAAEQPPENFISANDFEALVSAMTHDVEHDSELRPVRISQGSLGSYFVIGKREKVLDNDSGYTLEIYKRGIFKPKDEEPYGPLSPKWSKWLHRTFFPCFFGRACLIPNLGYVSEAAACVLDRQLLSFVVPHTDIIYLKSRAFYYTFWERVRSKPPKFKIGSFQMFLNGYIEAQQFFSLHPLPTDIEKLPTSKVIEIELPQAIEELDLQFRWTKEVIQQFQEQLEKLVILDYIMRNTDRGADNWMIKLEWRELSSEGITRKIYPFLKIGAIDSGLAFPWKHPDGWRSFPFGWLFLPYAIIGQPFSNKTRQHYLPLLTSSYWWEQTIIKLRNIFEQDADFKERMWLKQVAVLKGQAFNLEEVLKSPQAGPLELTRRESLLIWDDEMHVPIQVNNRVMSNALETSIYEVTSVSAEPQSSNNETTPLLEPPKKSKSDAGSLKSAFSESEPMRMSGFDYNMTYEGDDRSDREAHEETNTKIVVIERMEKADAKPPVFTWC